MTNHISIRQLPSSDITRIGEIDRSERIGRWFLTAQGFGLTQHPHPALLVLEPEDIHMIKRLA